MYRSNRVNIGHSSRLDYDRCAYEDKLHDSVSPFLYKVSPHQMYNCQGCLSVFGPRSSFNGYGVSVVNDKGYAVAQQQTDVESILTNRNVPTSKCKNKEINDINVTKFGLNHRQQCNHFLDPEATHLTEPPRTYREMSINRFYNLPINPQENIFYDFAVNTTLEAKDNHRQRIPRPIERDYSLPRTVTYACK